MICFLLFLSETLLNIPSNYSEGHHWNSELNDSEEINIFYLMQTPGWVAFFGIFGFSFDSTDSKWKWMNSDLNLLFFSSLRGQIKELLTDSITAFLAGYLFFHTADSIPCSSSSPSRPPLCHVRASLFKICLCYSYARSESAYHRYNIAFM